MNKQEMLLIKLGEECAEVAQIASKALRFGTDEVYPHQDVPLTNAERIEEELIDLFSIVRYLREEGVLEFDRINPDSEELYKQRKARIDKYLDYSRKLGILKD